MKSLVQEQNRESAVFALIAVSGDRDWFKAGYVEEAAHEGLPLVAARVPKLFGTGAFALFIFCNPIRALLRVVRDIWPDASIIVHSHSAWLTGAYLPLPKIGGVGLVATYHGVADDDRLRRLALLRVVHRYFARRLHRSSALVTAVSGETVTRACEIFGIKPEKFAVVPNGLVKNAAVPWGEKISDDLVVGHVGQMHHGKGWRLLVEAVDLLVAEGCPIQLVLAGTGEDSELAARQAEERASYCTFLGHVPDASRKLIPKLDVLVLASWSEGMPMTIIEALASGVAVVATRVGGIPEVIEDGVDGLLIDRSSAGIAVALKALLSNPKLREELAKNGRATFEEKFDISRVCQRYLVMYDGALSASASGDWCTFRSDK